MDLLTPRRVESEYGIPYNTLRNYRHQGTGPAYLKGPGRDGRIRYRRRDIETWLNGMAVTPGGAQ